MSSVDHFKKRSFDFSVALILLCLIGPIILLTWVASSLDTGANGFFTQIRVGRNGKLFKVVKLRTMRPEIGTTVTTAKDPRITKLGAIFRRWKIDELPQLFNVLVGTMSLVGPRPDVPGYLDELGGEDREVLQLRPGITGPASLKYRNEEVVLAGVEDPEAYNAEVIWPDKVRINRKYLHNWSFAKDVSYIWRTIFK